MGRSTTHLPQEILSLIIASCSHSQLFTLTQVNTVFREFAYENLPLPAEIPRKLAIHIISLRTIPSSTVPVDLELSDYLQAKDYSLDQIHRLYIFTHRQKIYETCGIDQIDVLRVKPLWDRLQSGLNYEEEQKEQDKKLRRALILQRKRQNGDAGDSQGFDLDYTT